MLTRLRIKNFKKFKDVDIELGQAVVLIGSNNSGKTAALQALALWDIGRRRWTEKRGGKPLGKRPGATINRNDLLAIPVPVAKLLWRNLHVQDVRRVGEARKQEMRQTCFSAERRVEAWHPASRASAAYADASTNCKS